MNRNAQVSCLIVAAALAWGSIPYEQPLPELVCLGAGEVVPEGYDRVHRVMQDRATELSPAMRKIVARAIVEESTRAGFDPLLILALIDVESDFEIRSVSTAGARGLMQIRPATLTYLAELEGVTDLGQAFSEDPAFDVRLGVRYLKNLKERFGSVDKALFAYNMGPAKMIRVWKANELHQYRGYLKAVKRDYAQLQRETGEPDDWTLASR